MTMLLGKIEPEGAPFTVSFTSSAVKGLKITVPTDAVLEVDYIELVDTSGGNNTLTLTDEGVNTDGNTFTRTIGVYPVSASSSLQITNIKDKKILNKLYAVSTGNMTVILHGRVVRGMK